MSKLAGSEHKIISELGEFGLIEHLMSKHNAGLPRNLNGVGDDCAVIPIGMIGKSEDTGSLLVTTDLMVENKHFRLSYFSPYDLGWKLLAVNLSDIAAMGGTPSFAFITLQLPPATSVHFVEELYRGIFELADKYNVKLMGGDTSGGDEMSLGMTLLGRVSGASPLLRSGAKSGDHLWVSGKLGAANIALAALEAGKSESLPAEHLQKFFRPHPQLELGSILREKGLASAALDISDGLIQDAGHLAAQSDLNVEIDIEKVPLASADALYSALCGGEDYQILFTCKPDISEGLLIELGKQPPSIGQVSPVQIGRVFPKSENQEKGTVFVCGKSLEQQPAAAYLKSNHKLKTQGFSHF